jgi:glutamyl-tRNA synthetase
MSDPPAMPSAEAPEPSPASYRGRLAPSPTGYLHLGHARTFWIAQERARQHRGILLLRNEDLDPGRARPEFTEAMLTDLAWAGFQWDEGPDRGGPFAPYNQSERGALYRAAFERLQQTGLVYPCTCSRKDILQALGAPHDGEDEPIYPGTCRPRTTTPPETSALGHAAAAGTRVNWRFRVPDGEAVSFLDGHYGVQTFIAGRDFGDFIVWRHDGLPSYQLAVVVDDHSMRITEVVRGADLLRSTARQLLLFRALDLIPPRFHHCPLATDDQGLRLAKRHDALSLRQLRARGFSPADLHQIIRRSLQDDRLPL